MLLQAGAALALDRHPLVPSFGDFIRGFVCRYHFVLAWRCGQGCSQMKIIQPLTSWALQGCFAALFQATLWLSTNNGCVVYR